MDDCVALINRLRSIAEHGGMNRSKDRRDHARGAPECMGPVLIVPFNTGHPAHQVDMGALPEPSPPSSRAEQVANHAASNTRATGRCGGPFRLTQPASPSGSPGSSGTFRCPWRQRSSAREMTRSDHRTDGRRARRRARPSLTGPDLHPHGQFFDIDTRPNRACGHRSSDWPRTPRFVVRANTFGDLAGHRRTANTLTTKVRPSSSRSD